MRPRVPTELELPVLDRLRLTPLVVPLRDLLRSMLLVPPVLDLLRLTPLVPPVLDLLRSMLRSLLREIEPRDPPVAVLPARMVPLRRIRVSRYVTGLKFRVYSALVWVGR